MTIVRQIYCDMCDKEQKLYDDMIPTFTHISNSAFPYKDKPTNLCPECTKIVFDFMKDVRGKKENTIVSSSM